MTQKIKPLSSAITIIMKSLWNQLGVDVKVRRDTYHENPTGCRGMRTVTATRASDESTLRRTEQWRYPWDGTTQQDREAVREREATALLNCLIYVASTYNLNYGKISLDEVMPVFMRDMPEARKVFSDCIEKLRTGDRSAF